jgi:hypothetical protein
MQYVVYSSVSIKSHSSSLDFSGPFLHTRYVPGCHALALNVKGSVQDEISFNSFNLAQGM